MKPWVRALKQRTFGAGKFSQSYQDELLEIIFSHVGTGNSPPFCVEFGFSSHRLTGGRSFSPTWALEIRPRSASSSVSVPTV
jgi:hypothetical protein